MQPAAAHHPLHLVPREPEPEELPVCDRAVLRDREPAELVAPSRSKLRVSRHERRRRRAGASGAGEICAASTCAAEGVDEMPRGAA
jgi:hypothetical protein